MPQVEIAEIIDTPTIDDVYNATNLGDTSKSIYKVGQFRASFPNTLPAETIKASLPGIISASGLSVDELVMDGQNRITALSNYLTDYSGKKDAEVVDYTNQITELSAKIQELQGKITEAQKAKEDFNKLVEAEIAAVDENLKFI
jgi:peptidoglycan hydrolase CwlO-like protein